jgi:hypothetical protein
MALQQFQDCGTIPDIRAHEHVIGIPLEIPQVFQVARVSERVEVHNQVSGACPAGQAYVT